MKRVLTHTVVTLSLILAAPMLLAAGKAKPDEAAELMETLKASLPNVTIERVLPSEAMPGLYEIVTASDVLYSDRSGSRVFVGKVYDAQSREDLTAHRWDELHSVDFSALPLQSAIKNVKGDGSRTVVVFADPLCPYCQQLEQTLQHVDNLTVYTFLYPLESVHPGATEKARKIACSSEPALAWSAWMLSRTEPEAKSCADNRLDAFAELGQKLQVSSTPTVFFATGERATGALPLAAFEKRLTAAANPSTAARSARR